MLKACFDCDSETIITDVIHKRTDYSVIRGLGLLRGLNFRLYTLEKIVEYTCISCATKYYVTVSCELCREYY